MCYKRHRRPMVLLDEHLSTSTRRLECQPSAEAVSAFACQANETSSKACFSNSNEHPVPAHKPHSIAYDNEITNSIKEQSIRRREPEPNQAERSGTEHKTIAKPSHQESLLTKAAASATAKPSSYSAATRVQSTLKKKDVIEPEEGKRSGTSVSRKESSVLNIADCDDDDENDGAQSRLDVQNTSSSASKSITNATTPKTRSNGEPQDKRQQFSIKQRMDMYAFCVLELEMFSNKVSIKKQQQAILRALHEDEQRLKANNNNNNYDSKNGHSTTACSRECKPASASNKSNDYTNDTNNCGGLTKSLLELQREVSLHRECYGDYQRTQVLTSSMLRDVQERFARYYPNSVIPSRTTIKHVFEKCVAFGTVANIKTPRKTTKIAQSHELEQLLASEPKLSLRQMAHKLNVSTGTVSRRCKALGLVPESVTKRKLQKITKNYKRE